MAGDIIEVDGIRKAFAVGGGETLAIRDVSLNLREGEFLSLVGPSGCGKTTLLRTIAGLLRTDAGEVRLRGRHVDGVLPTLQVVFQEYNRSLFPWLSVDKNVRFPLKGVPKAEADERVADALRVVGLEGFEQHYPWQLSGGMQQRVAIARSVAARAELLLMDEPFASVDAQTRISLEMMLLELWERLRISVLFVTHDIEEAILLADRVVVLGGLGRVLVDRTIDLPRPRIADDIQVDPTYVSLYREMADALKGAAR
jgi:NitT/TauT family transport system ATP-binding protein